MLSPDLPIAKLEEDGLNRGSFAESLAKTLVQYSFPSSLTIGLYGEWGSGKTSLLNMVFENVERIDDGVVVLRFNPWLCSDSKQLVTQFFKQMATAIKLKKRAADKAWELIDQYADILGATSVIPVAGEIVAAFTKVLNCRITAFGLFSEFITAGADRPEVQGEDSLFTDLETIDANPDALCGDSTAKFCALFAPVNAADSTEVEAQVKALQEGWAARGIAFADSKASMISVVFHDKFSDEDNTLFIGHVGVLLPAEDGSLYFIEKVAFQEPYRLVKLQNRTELSDYLMEKYDTSWGQDTTHPFIMENDTLMDGYRPNPLEETNP